MSDEASGNDRFRLLFSGAPDAKQGVTTTRTMIMQMQKAHSLEKAMFNSGRAVGDPLPLVQKTLLWLSRFLIAAAEEHGRRRAIRDLQRFDNHMLADIGIKRGEIEKVVRKGRGAL